MYSLKQIAGLLNAPIASDDGTISIKGFSSLSEAAENELSFYADQKYSDAFENSRAAAIIVNNAKELSHKHAILLKVDDVRVAVASLLHHLHQANRPAPGVHQTAVIHHDAQVADDAYIGPYVVIDQGVRIGNLVQVHAHASIGQGSILADETILHAGVRVYPQTRIGKRCIIHANAVLGSDGFGYAPGDNGKLIKIPQVGIVVLEDDVEIGANTVIDRASIGKTHICNGVKLDNLIQIAHNVTIGEHTAIAAQAGIAGSTSIGSNSRIGGQAGIVGHIHIPAKTSIQAQSGVIKAPAKPGTALYGSPAFDYRSFMKSYAFFKNLPAIVHDLKNKE